METLITVLGYVAVFGAAAVVALIPGVIVYFLLRKSQGKLVSYFIGFVLVLCALLSVSRDPFLTYDKSCTQGLTQEQEDAVRSVCAGAYSTRMPLLPLLIRVSETEEDYAAWTEFYFPYGTREMELSGADGFNCVKPLF